MSSELTRRSLVELAVERMRERILQGDWQIGQRLPTEPVLAVELGISRNTVREAMRVLAFSGLVEIRQGDGSYLRTAQDPLQAVQAMSRCSPEHARETRHILEAEAIGLPRRGVPMPTCRRCVMLWRSVPGIFMAMLPPTWPATWCFTNGWSMPPTTRHSASCTATFPGWWLPRCSTT